MRVDRRTTSPFALCVFYRTGAFHRPDEFTSDRLPPHLTVYTWLDCTLTELAHYIAMSSASLLPFPAIGTRLAFRLICRDTRKTTTSAQMPRFIVKELGSMVIGDGAAGLDPDDATAEKKLEADREKTLGEARFVVGDYLSVAILPPLSDGSVAPLSAAKMGRGHGAGEVKTDIGRAPVPLVKHRMVGTRPNQDAVRGWRRGEQPPDHPRRARGSF